MVKKKHVRIIQVLAVLVGLGGGVAVTQAVVHNSAHDDSEPATVINLPPEPTATPPEDEPPIMDWEPATPYPYDFRPEIEPEEQEEPEAVKSERDPEPGGKSTKHSAGTAPEKPKKSRPAPKKQTSEPKPAKPKPKTPSIRQQAETILRSLPRTKNVKIIWDHEYVKNYYGAAEPINYPNTIMLNSKKLAAHPGFLKSVVYHEVAHLYQASLATKMGTYFFGLETNGYLKSAFGSNGIEKLADCVVIKLGAPPTGYTSNCGGKERQEWVNAVINNTPPPSFKPPKVQEPAKPEPKPDPTPAPPEKERGESSNQP